MVVEERERSERREGGVGREAQRRRAALGSSNDGGTGQTHGHKLRSGRLGRSGFFLFFSPHRTHWFSPPKSGLRGSGNRNLRGFDQLHWKFCLGRPEPS